MQDQQKAGSLEGVDLILEMLSLNQLTNTCNTDFFVLCAILKSL